MKLTDLLLAIVGTFFLVLLQALGTREGILPTVLCAALLPLLGAGLLALFKVTMVRRWHAPLACALAAVAGALLMEAYSPYLLSFLLLATASAVLSGLLLVWFSSPRRHCSLCSHRIGSREISFACPRCGMTVCEKSCWRFDSLRCRLCDQNRVPIFPADGRWWDRNFGKSVQHGRCQLCLTSCDRADLRLCARCGRPYCRSCWDYKNGQCGRCGWCARELPKPLCAYLSPTESISH